MSLRTMGGCSADAGIFTALSARFLPLWARAPQQSPQRCHYAPSLPIPAPEAAARHRARSRRPGRGHGCESGGRSLQARLPPSNHAEPCTNQQTRQCRKRCPQESTNRAEKWPEQPVSPQPIGRSHVRHDECAEHCHCPHPGQQGQPNHTCPGEYCGRIALAGKTCGRIGRQPTRSQSNNAAQKQPCQTAKQEKPWKGRKQRSTNKQFLFR